MHMVILREFRLIRLIRRGCEMVSSARACHLIWGKTEQDEEMEVWSNSGGSWWNGQVAPVHVGKVCSLTRSSRCDLVLGDLKVHARY